MEGFEYGHIFSQNLTNKKYEEIESIGEIFNSFNSKRNGSEGEKISSWFEAKGRIEGIF